MAESKRGPGRPALVQGEKSERLHFRISPALHDRACIAAICSRRSVSEVIRAALEHYLRKDQP